MKLAWAFMNIMNLTYHFGILHNDLLNDNIMLHFPTNKTNVIYIGVCDWGEAICMQEVTPSLYMHLLRSRFSSTQKKCVSGWP
jgi:hypothetical protein